MATIRVTEGDLRAAMRDPRYWQSGHPERGAYAGWVTEGWHRLHGAEATTEGGTRVVRVREGGRIVSRPVELGISTPEGVEIRTGISPGDVVVLQE